MRPTLPLFQNGENKSLQSVDSSDQLQAVTLLDYNISDRCVITIRGVSK